MQQLIWLLYRRVSIALNYPQLKRAITTLDHHEVIADQFKRVFVQFETVFARVHRFINHLHDHLIKFRTLTARIFTKRLHTRDVSFLKFTVVTRVLLDSIVSQVYVFTLLTFVQFVNFTRCADVPFATPVNLTLRCEASPNPNVKFPLLKQHWLFYVLLHNKRLRFY